MFFFIRNQERVANVNFFYKAQLPMQTVLNLFNLLLK